MADRAVTRRLVAWTLVLSLGIGQSARGAVPGVGGIVYDPSNWVQNYTQVVNSLTQISQLSDVIVNGALTVENLLSLIQLGQQTITGVNGLVNDTVYLLSGRLFVDYNEQVSGLFNGWNTLTQNLVVASNASNRLADTSDFQDPTTPTGQKLSATLMDGQSEAYQGQTNHDRLVQYVDYQMQVDLPNMYQLQLEVLQISYKIRCQTEPLDSLPEEVKQVCDATGLDQYNIPILMSQYQSNFLILQQLQQASGENSGVAYGQVSEGQNLSFAVQVSNTQQTLTTTIEQAQLLLEQSRTELQAKQAELEVARASLERSAREEEIRALSVSLTEPYILSNEIQQFYGP